MAALLKNVFNKKFISKLSGEIKNKSPNFNEELFFESVFNKDWKNKELKQRIRHITKTIKVGLPYSYIKSIKILKPVSLKFSGLLFWILLKNTFNESYSFFRLSAKNSLLKINLEFGSTF